MMAATAPITKVNQAMRRSVAAPETLSAMEVFGLGSELKLPLTGRSITGYSNSPGSTETPEHFFQSGGKSEAAEQQGENYFGVQPAVEKETEQAAENDRANDGEWQLHRQSRVGQVFFCFRSVGRGRFRFVGLLVQ
jgi:hypothetical protein